MEPPTDINRSLFERYANPRGINPDRNGQEHVAENKTDRARQIHLYGFT